MSTSDPHLIEALALLNEQVGQLLTAKNSIASTASSQLEDGRAWYSTEEAATLLGKAPFTVRAWCRNGRIEARKREAGRGKWGEWEVSAEEIARYRDHGLLPAD